MKELREGIDMKELTWRNWHEWIETKESTWRNRLRHPALGWNQSDTLLQSLAPLFTKSINSVAKWLLHRFDGLSHQVVRTPRPTRFRQSSHHLQRQTMRRNCFWSPRPVLPHPWCLPNLIRSMVRTSICWAFPWSYKGRRQLQIEKPNCSCGHHVIQKPQQSMHHHDKM